MRLLPVPQNYHWVNTNSGRLPDGDPGTEIYAHNVVATFGQYDEFGHHLENLSQGDAVFSYQNGVGVRAIGLVVGDFDEKPVEPSNMIFHSADSDANEYHVPVRWQVVLDEEAAVTHGEVEQITGQPLHGTGTYAPVNEVSNPELLADVIYGRTRD